ncbi:hypothetical protein [Collinsella sp. D33t1_170424_A12]
MCGLALAAATTISVSSRISSRRPAMVPSLVVPSTSPTLVM